MDSIEIKRPVLIKVIMTDDFRDQLTSEAEATLARIEENIEILDKECEKKAEELKEKPEELKQFKDAVNADKERLAQMKAELDLRTQQLNNAANGEEYPFRVFEGPVVVKVGDNMMDKVSKTEIVLKDWKVVEIRNV